VRNIFRKRVLGAYAASVDRACLASFGQGVIAGVEILSLLEMLGHVVGLGWKLAIQSEETLLIGRQRSDVNFVLLMRVHLDSGAIVVCS